jgi:hypothetical protein
MVERPTAAGVPIDVSWPDAPAIKWRVRRVGGGAQGSLSEWGTLDRRELAKRNVKTVLAESPAVGGEADRPGP